MAKEKIEGLNIWLPQSEGEMLSGLIVKIDNAGDYGTQAVIKNKDGIELLTPSHKWLQNCLKRLNVGDSVEIKYIGEEAPKVKGQSPTKKYEVFRITA